MIQPLMNSFPKSKTSLFFSNSLFNTCSFTDSLLPSDLDTRFQRLKSLPNPPTKDQQPNNPVNNKDASAGDEESADEKEEKNHKSKQDQFGYSFKRNSENGSILESGSLDSDLDSPISSMDLPSPPSRRRGCFWCSPKKKKKKKKESKEKGKLDWGKKDDEEFMRL